MTKAQKEAVIIFTIVVLGLVSYLVLRKPSVREILTAKNYGIGSEAQLFLFSDSTYHIKVKYQDISDSVKTQLISGKFYFTNDTLYFPNGIKGTKINKATIKNNVVEFIGMPAGGFSIIETELELKPVIDPEKYPYYKIYTYNPEYEKLFPEGSKPYDLIEEDIVQLETILRKQPKDSLAGKCDKQDEKTCRAAITPKGQKEIFLECGGIAVIVNLTTGKCNRIVCLGG